VQEVPLQQVSSYGIVAVQKELESGIFELSGLVEKPKVAEAPSQLAIVGRYILSSAIFPYLERISSQVGSQVGTVGKEIQLTDALALMLRDGNRVIACTLKGTRYDIGTPLGWLHANIAYGLSVPEYADSIKKMIQPF
jgi:UTP--glucose-1-phosphate uridylyltransferase